MKLLESRQKAAQRGRRGGVAAIQFRDVAKQRNRIHKMGTRRGGDRMGNQKMVDEVELYDVDPRQHFGQLLIIINTNN